MLRSCIWSPMHFSLLHCWLRLFGLRGWITQKHAASFNPPTLEKQINCISPCSDSRFRLSKKQRKLSCVSRSELCTATASLQLRSCRLLPTWIRRTARTVMLMKDHSEQSRQREIFSCYILLHGWFVSFMQSSQGREDLAYWLWKIQIHPHNKYQSMHITHDLKHMMTSNFSMAYFSWKTSLTVAVCVLSDDSNMFIDVHRYSQFTKTGHSLYNVYNSPQGLRHSRNYMKYLVGSLVIWHC